MIKIMGRYCMQRNKLFPLLVITLLCIIAAELAARFFWYYSYDIPFYSPDRILYAYYPELKKLEAVRPSHDDGIFDILLLGGSVLHPDFGYVEQILKQKLFYNGYRNVRIYNLAVAAHTSRDSLLKYAAIDKASSFDLIVFYHGINEVRANNVPPSLFRDNYDHYSWYEIVNTLSSYTSANFALPYSMHYIGLSLWQRIYSDNYVPTHVPRNDWTQYGKVSRSVISFKHNIEKILGIASRRNDRVLLLTVAIHVPENYSYDLFKLRGLDYGLHLAPIEIWGDPVNVVATVDLHNDVIRELAVSHSEVFFIDMATRLPRSGRYFNDLCHLTTEGSAIFADNVLNLISQLPESKRTPLHGLLPN